MQHEIKMIAHVIQAKAKVLLLRTEAGQFIHAVAQPVVVMLPVFIFNEIGEGFLHHLQPLRRVGQAVQAHQGKSRFAIVINDAEFGFQRQIAAI